MNQAIRMSEVDNGEMKTWDLNCGSSNSPTCSYDDILAKYNKYFNPYLKTINKEKSKDNNGLLLYFADGSILRITNQFYDMGFALNKKAFDNPSAGITYFNFRFNPVKLPFQNDNDVTYSIGKGFEPYTFSWDGTRQDLFNNEYGCGNTYNAFCAKLIQYEGWQIPKDYPFKF